MPIHRLYVNHSIPNAYDGTVASTVGCMVGECAAGDEAEWNSSASSDGTGVRGGTGLIKLFLGRRAGEGIIQSILALILASGISPAAE